MGSGQTQHCLWKTRCECLCPAGDPLLLPFLALTCLQGTLRMGGPGQPRDPAAMPPFLSLVSAGIKGPSAEQMPRTCSGCAKRPAIWCSNSETSKNDFSLSTQVSGACWLGALDKMSLSG